MRKDHLEKGIILKWIVNKYDGSGEDSSTSG
jgi:hypothetical protein